MLSVSQINKLRDNKEYKKTKGVMYNWEQSKAVCSSEDFSISVDIWVNGVSYKQLHMLGKVMIWFSKRLTIAKEIGKYRNKVIERILDSSIPDDFDICDLITPDYKWVANKVHKLNHIKIFTTDFITDSRIQVIMFDILDYSESDVHKKKIFMSSLLEKTNELFNQKIKSLLWQESISAHHEYIKYAEYLQEKMIQNQTSGNLVTVVRKESKVVGDDHV